jgi:hypothetical protein
MKNKMTSRIYILIIVVQFIICGLIQAQSSAFGMNNSYVSEYNRYQVHLDFQVLGGRSSTFGVVFKKAFGLEDFAYNYYFTNLRFVSTYNYNFMFTDAPQFDGFLADQYGTAVYSGIGYERQQMASGRFGFVYGADLIFTRETRIPSFGLNDERGPRARLDRRNLGVGVNPFVGVIFYLSQNFSIVAETGIFLRFINKTNRELEVLYFNNFGSNEIIINTIDVWIDRVFDYGFNNLRFLSFNLHF